MGFPFELEFDKPLKELERQITELKRTAVERELDVGREIAPLEQKLAELRREIYDNLTPMQRVQVARHPRRPYTMDYLETVAPAEGFVFGDLSLADIAIAVPFANLAWSRVEADLSAWPKTVAWVERTEATPPLARLTMLGARFLATRVAERAALFAELGVTMSAVSHAGEGFRRGPMTV